jgi:peroxiredoxin
MTVSVVLLLCVMACVMACATAVGASEYTVSEERQQQVDRETAKRAAREAEQDAYLKEFHAKPFTGYYEPLSPTPAGAVKSQSCAKGWDFSDLSTVDSWVQGETAPDAGALTLFFFFCADDTKECKIGRTMSAYLDKLYKKFKHRGLQVVGIHSDFTGYRATGKEPHNDLDELKLLIDKRKLSFPIADTHSKDGKSKTVEEIRAMSAKDYQHHSQGSLLQDSLWAKINIPYGHLIPDAREGHAGEMEKYTTPYLVAMKDCKRIAVAGGSPGLEGQMQDIEGALKPHWDVLLWPDDGSGPTDKKLIKGKKPGAKHPDIEVSLGLWKEEL